MNTEVQCLRQHQVDLSVPPGLPVRRSGKTEIRPLFSDALELIAAVNLIRLPGRSELKSLGELIVGDDLIGFPGFPRTVIVLDLLAVEHQLRSRAQSWIERIQNHEAFLVELPEYESLPALVVAEEAPMLMHFTCFVLFLRRIGGCVAFVDETVAQNELVPA